MFYICKGTCLCLSGQGQGTVVYCYGDPSARNLHQLGPGDLGEDEGGGLGGLDRYSLLDLAQLAVYTLGILAILIALILIRNSVKSLERNVTGLWSILDLDLDMEAGSRVGDKEAGEKMEGLAVEQNGGPHPLYQAQHSASTAICDL